MNKVKRRAIRNVEKQKAALGGGWTVYAMCHPPLHASPMIKNDFKNFGNYGG